MARKNRSLKLLRLARDKKSLIWQKRYLTKVLEQQYREQRSGLIPSDSTSTTSAKTLFALKVSVISVPIHCPCRDNRCMLKHDVVTFSNLFHFSDLS